MGITYFFSKNSREKKIMGKNKTSINEQGKNSDFHK
jgi:hypothetical protein